MQRSKKQFLRPTWKVVFYAKSLLLHIFKSEALCQTKKFRVYFHSWSIHGMSTLKYKKVRKLCTSMINTNHYWNCRLSNLHFTQIHTLHFYKYQYRYTTILTYRKLHIQTYFLPSCICRQEKIWWEYIRTCNIKQYTSVL